MAERGDVDAVLGQLGRVSEAFANVVASLDSVSLRLPTNCPPWSVRDLAVHVVVGGRGFATAVRCGLSGSLEPDAVASARAAEEAVLGAGDASVIVHELAHVTKEFAALYDTLDGAALDVLCFHRRGNRPVRWYAVHRLAEVAFHLYDLERSLGRPAVLDERVAALLLPTLIETNAPRTYAAGTSAERGNGERYVLAVNGDGDAGPAWAITVGTDALIVERLDSSSHEPHKPANLRFEGPASSLALLVYGRMGAASGIEGGNLRARGDLGLAERFDRTFPRP